jgi:hypothetical protein
MNIRALVMAGLLVAASSFAVHAQPTIVRSVIGSGGNFMSGGTFAMDGTVGQAVIGITSGGSPIITDYQGFWHGLIPLGVKVTPNGGADGFALEQNYPNPFNPSTTIKFSVPTRTKVTIRVLNLLGEEVYRIIDGKSYDAGSWDVEFSADDVLPSGTYVYRMEADNFVASKKMVLLK